MKKKNMIIQSLLDVDIYKFTMMQFAFLLFRHILVVFGFKNRTKKVKLAKVIKLKDIKTQFDHVRTLRFKEKELEYLESLGYFQKRFLQFLRELSLPSYEIKEEDGHFIIEFSGYWPEVSLWETISLSIINELYYQALLGKMTQKERLKVYQEGRKRLAAKIEVLKKNPKIKFVEFGTRRRFSRAWQYIVLERLLLSVPNQVLGTSNVHLAMKLGITPIGTFAHELLMTVAAICRSKSNTYASIRNSQDYVFNEWWEMYGEKLSIALTDTYGNDFTFETMTGSQARKWRGLRHDSGDPIEFGEKAIAFYEKHGVIPSTKTIVFSDGLDVEKIVEIHNHFEGRIQCVFGWGTNLTNDLGLESLSLVTKVVEAAKWSTVKLSDNIAKAMGKLKDIEWFKKIFDYKNTHEEECVY